MSVESFRGVLFNLYILSLCSGCSAVPQKLSYISLFSPFITIFVGFVNLWDLFLFSYLYSKHKIKRNDLLAQKLYGKNLRNLLRLTMIINQCGIILIYHVIIYKLIGELLMKLKDMVLEILIIFLIIF